MMSGFDLSKQKIAIIGLGLMGGSLALALRGACQKILAVDQNPETIRFATQHQIVDLISDSPQEILPQADVIILATPVLTILKLIESLPDWKPEGAVVIDLGSTKQQVCQALAQLPDQFSAVGGHPMCGKTEFTLKNAEADLFRGSPFVLVNLPNSKPFSIQLAEEIAVNIGAKPLWLDAETHDHITAITSHFPFLLANLMAGITPPEAAPLTATGWLSTTRLASSSLQMMADILKTNRLQVLSVLEQFSKQLDLVRNLLENENFDSLNKVLTTGKEQHQDIITKEHLSS